MKRVPEKPSLLTQGQLRMVKMACLSVVNCLEPVQYAVSGGEQSLLRACKKVLEVIVETGDGRGED